ncbi:MAG: transcriptional regulator [Dyadobacter sp. 50-39]|uniref:transcriptional regulator n=1 Tax=Dyadobacter sp. 50-39 TaxID=1895756 RepID=UPI000969FDCE|nr:transcriptional regulator [Dyadobacter sp. 50-39]OJV21154.1 MAG: transcriptional regulator [Dyadobacter sp. 50-39]
MENLKPAYKVTNDEEHAAMIEKVGALMEKDEADTTAEENARIRAMAEAIMAYEQSIYDIPEPSTLEGILELRRYDMMCEGKDLAETLGISNEMLQTIIDGDYWPDVSLLKVIREKLDIPEDIVLNHA